MRMLFCTLLDIAGSGRLSSCNVGQTGGQGNLRGCVEMHSLQARNGGIVS